MSRKGIARLAAAVLALSMGGCTDSTRAPELAKAGAAAATTLAAYYDSLIQTSIDAWDLDAFYNAVNELPPQPDIERAMLRRIQLLRPRAAMARELASAYQALGALAESKGGGAPEAAGRLGESLRALPRWDIQQPDPAGLFKVATQRLIGLQQSRDVLRGSEALAETLQQIRELVRLEAPVYRSIDEERDRKAKNVAAYLLENRKVSIWPALERIPKLIKLPWQDQGRLAQDAKLIEAAIAMTLSESRRASLLSENAAANIGLALESLAARHRDLAAQRPVNLDDALRAVRAAQSDLDEIDRLRRPPKKEGP